MPARFVQRVLSERTTGVPRRMPLGALFVLVTAFCLLFRLLTLLGAPPIFTGCAGLFAVCIATSQALLYGGIRPRDASMVAGTVALPLIFLGGYLAMLLSRDWFAPGYIAVLMGVFISTLVGPVVGYLVGIFIAGSIFLANNWFIDEETTGELIGPPEGNDGQFLQWLNRAFRSGPRNQKFVCIGAVVCASLLFLAALPIIYKRSFSIFELATIWIGLCGVFAVASAILQLRYRSILFLLPFLFFPFWLPKRIGVLPHIDLQQGWVDIALLAVFVPAGCLFLASLGWLQILIRKQLWPEFQIDHFRPAITVSLVLLAVFGYLGYQAVQLQYLPQVVALNEANQRGVMVHFWPPRSVSSLLSPIAHSIFVAGEGDDEALELALLQIDRTTVQWYSAAYSKITDQSVRRFADGRLQYLDLSGTGISPSVFRGNDLVVQYLVLKETAVDDSTLADLAQSRLLRQSIQTLMLHQTRVTDEGLEHLAKLRALKTIDISGCQISGIGFSGLPPRSMPISINVSFTELNDEGIKNLVQSFPRTHTLDICETKLTAAGLAELAKLKELQTLTIVAGQFTPSQLDDFSRSLRANRDAGARQLEILELEADELPISQ